MIGLSTKEVAQSVRVIDEFMIEVDRFIPEVTTTERHNRQDLEERLKSLLAKKQSDDYIHDQQVNQITDLLKICDDAGVLPERSKK